MERKPKIEIKTDGIGKTKVVVNGKELEGVIGIKFSQSYKENSGLPILQIDMKATNVSLDANILPALPEPFKGMYISVNELFNSEEITKEEAEKVCREQGIEFLDSF